MNSATRWLKPLLNLANLIGSGRRGARGKKPRSAVRTIRRVQPFLELLESRIVPSDVFLQGNYVEVGINNAGSFGTSTSAPAGYHARPEYGQTGGELGFVADPAKDGWKSYYGDYFVPGSPFEGWGVKWGPSTGTHLFSNAGLMGMDDVPTTSLTKTSSGTTESAVWVGTATSGSDQLKITQTVSFGVNDLYFVIDVVMTNVGTTTLQNVEYSRAVDPDNEEPLTDDYTTSNYIADQPPHTGVTTAYPAGNTDQALVVADGLTYGEPLGLGTFDSRATVSIGTTLDPDQTINQSTMPSPVPTAASPDVSDTYISLAFSLGNLAPGQSTTIDYAYILGVSDLTAALGALGAVSILQPSGTVSGSGVSFQATTSNLPSTTQMEFFVNGTSIGVATTPDAGGVYSKTFDSTAYPNGTLNLTAVATFAGGTTDSKSTSVTVSNSGPPISITTPTAGQIFSGSSIPISVTATGPDLPVRVDFFRQTADKGTTSLGEVTGSSPFVSSFSVADLPLGDTVNITAVATDSLGRTTTVTVTGTASAGVSKLSFTTQPPSGSLTAGSNDVGTVAVTAVDSSGNKVVGQAVTLSISSPGVIYAGTISATTGSSGIATFSGLTVETAGSFTITATASSVTTTSTSFTIVPAAASKISFIGTSSGTYNAGATFTPVIVQVTDAYSNPVANIAVGIKSTSGNALSGVPAILPTTNSSGEVTFSGLSETLAGTYTLTASAVSPALTSSPSGSYVIKSSTGIISFSTQPNPSGPVQDDPNDLSAVVVTITDSFGNPVSGDVVSLAISPTVTLSPGYTSVTTGSSGTATFSIQTVSTVGTYTLIASSTGLTSVKSNSFTIIPAAVYALSFSTQPSGPDMAGSTISPAPVVTVTDKAGMVVPNAIISIQNTSGTALSAGSVLTVTTNSSGLATFSGLKENTIGTYFLTATYTPTTGSPVTTNSSGSYIVTPSAGTMAFTTQPNTSSPSVPAGANNLSAVVVTITDSFGNKVSNQAVSLAISPTTTLSPGYVSVTTGSSGTATFNVQTVTAVGTYTLTASSTGLTSIVSSPFTITPAAVYALSFSTQPSGLDIAGTTISPASVVKATDQYGNVVPNAIISIQNTSGTALSAGSVLTATTNSSGQATFSGLKENTIGTYTLTATYTPTTGSSVTTNSSGSYIVTSSAGTMAFTTQPNTSSPSVPAGANNLSAVVVTITDSFGNKVSNQAVSLTISPTTTLSPGYVSVTTGSSGTATFNVQTVTAVGTYTLTASSTGLTSIVSSPFTITPAAVYALSFSTQPSGTDIAGTTISPAPVVKATDQYGNVVPNAIISIQNTSGAALSAGSVLTATTNPSGQAVFSNLVETTAGTYTLSASSTGLSSITSGSFVISPSQTTETMTFSTPPNVGPTAAGTALNTVVVTILDKYNNPAIGSVVTISSSGTLSAGNTTATTDSSGTASFSGLSVQQMGTYFLTATSGSLTKNSANFIIKAGTPHLSFSQGPSSTIAGSTISPSVSVLVADTFGNPISGTSVSIQTSSAPALTSGTLTVATNASGFAVFSNLVETAVGTYALTASSTGLSSITSGSFVISLSQTTEAMTFSTPPNPGPTAAGTVLNTVVVTIADKYNNPVTNTVVTISSSGTLNTGNTTATTGPSGTASFSGLSVQQMGTYFLTATAGTLTKNSTNFIIKAGTPHLTFSQGPSSTTAGSTLSPSVAVLVADSFNNPISGTSVSIQTSSGTALTSGTLTVATNTSGFAVFSNLVETAVGTYTLTATSTGLSSITSGSFVISLSQTTEAITFSTPPNAGPTAAGLALNTVVVTIADKYNNPVTNTVVTISSSGTLNTGNTTATTGPSGTASFSGLSVQQMGTYFLTATAGTLTKNSTNFIIKAGTAHLTFSQGPSSTTAGSTITPSVSVLVADSFNNPISGTSVSIQTTSGKALTSGTLTVATNASGLAVFSNLVETAVGTYTLTASSTGLSSITSGSFVISLSQTTEAITFSTQPNLGPTTAGLALNTVVVTIADKYNNPVTNTVVTISSSATLSAGNTTATTGPSGTASFSGLSVQTPGTYLLTATAGTLTKNSTNFAIKAAAASQSKFSFVSQPTSTVAAGSTIGTVSVQVADQYGNPLSGVSVGIKNTSGAALSSGTLTVATNASGLAVFSNLVENYTGTYTLTATSGTLTAIQSSTYIVSPTATTMSFLTGAGYGPSSNAVAGSTWASPVVVKIADKFGNGAVTGTAVTLAITTSGVPLYVGGNPNTSITFNTVSGLASFSGLSVQQAGTYTLTASSLGLSPIVSSKIVIAAGAANQSHFSFVSQPTSTVAAGSTIGTVSVQVADQYGNPLSGVSIGIKNTSGAALSSGTLTVATTASGLAVFSNLVEKTVGSYTLTATYGTLTPIQSSTYTVSASTGIITFLTGATYGPSSSAVAGSTWITPVVVKVADNYGNMVADGTPVTIAITTAGVPLFKNSVSNSSVPITVNTVSGYASFTGLSVQKAGTFTLTASSNGLNSALSGKFTITASSGVLANFTFVTQPNNSNAGAAISPYVAVQLADAYGNLVSGTTVTIAISSGPAFTGSVTTATTSAAGLAVFSKLVETAAGSYTLSASATLSGTSASITSGGFTVARATNTLTFTGQPPTYSPSPIAGATWSSPVTVLVKDSYNNLAADDTPVTIAVSTSGVPLYTGTTPNTTITAYTASGYASFSGLSVQKAGTFTLTASSSGLVSVLSGKFAITAGPAYSVSLTSQPMNAAAASTINTVTAQLYDQYGNPSLTPGTTVTMSNVSGTLSGVTTTTTNASGLAVFTALSENFTGTYNLTASSTGLVSFSQSNSFTVSPGKATNLTFTAQPTTPLTASSSDIASNTNPVTLTLTDAKGNDIPGATVTISIYNYPSNTSSSFTSGNLTAVTDSSGVASFTNLTKTLVGTYELKAASSGIFSPYSNSFVINPAAASGLSFSAQPTSTSADNPIGNGNVRVQIVDPYGNAVAQQYSTITLSFLTGTQFYYDYNDGNGSTGMPSASLTTDVNGQAVFSTLKEHTTGTYALQATDPSDGFVSATSKSFAITAGAATQMTFTSQPAGGQYQNSTLGATTGTVIVQLLDQYGNYANQAGVSVIITINNLAGGSLNGPTIKTNSLGQAVFSLMLSTQGTYDLTAAATVANVPLTLLGDSNSFTITPAPKRWV